MHLVDIKIQDLNTFSSLSLNDLKKMVTFIGPNGSGKSTAIRSIHHILSILSEKTLAAYVDNKEEWLLFSKAEVVFENLRQVQHDFKIEYFDDNLDSIEFTIELNNDQKNYIIRKISNGKNYIQIIDDEIQPIEDINEINKKLKNLQKDIESINSQGINHEQRSRKIQSISNEIKKLNSDLTNYDQVQIQCSSDAEIKNISRIKLDDFLDQICPEKPIYIPPQTTPEGSIEEFIETLIELKLGEREDVLEFQRILDDLNRLLQSDIQVYQRKNKKHLTINGIPYKNASTGTSTSLSFYGLTYSNRFNPIIFWDEPENGLHPTRRYKLLNLMKSDRRQFVLATHTTEFAQILSSRNSIYKFNADFKYENANSKSQLSAMPLINRTSAFQLIEDLGISPANVLFTSNIVIWVEGPSDLYYYRHWLKKLLPVHYQEGFHYTFMQYGGSLISYLEAIDNKSKFNSLLDILSLCSNPVITVDSDFTKAPTNTPPISCLKKSAIKLHQQIQILNQNRPGSAMFIYSCGREIENYLPGKAIEYAVNNVIEYTQDEKDKLKLSEIDFSKHQYDKYYETLKKHFISKKVCNTKNIPKGISKWGDANKPEFMKAALALDTLSVNDLLFEGETKLRSLVDFIRAKSIQ